MSQPDDPATDGGAVESVRGTLQTPDEKLPVEWIERSQLLPNDWNPNAMGASKLYELIASIRDNGWTQPIVVRGDTDVIVDGEQRWHAAGETVEIDGESYRVADDENLTPDDVPAGHVPVYRLYVDETQARVATLQHNRAKGLHDVDKLADLLAELDGMEMLDTATEHMNIDDSSLDRLLDRATVVEGGTPGPGELFDIPWDEDDSPEDAEDYTGAYVERVDFLVTDEEMERVQKVLSDDVRADLFIELCEYAIAEGIHEETRVDVERLEGSDE